VHDRDGWNALDVTTQERIIGPRRMLDELVGSPPADLYSATPVTAATRGCVQCSHLTDAWTMRDIRPLRPARIMRRAAMAKTG
jgi:hypothetical protein